MDQVDDVANDLQMIKGENCIVVRLKDGHKESKVILTNSVSVFMELITLSRMTFH